MTVVEVEALFPKSYSGNVQVSDLRQILTHMVESGEVGKEELHQLNDVEIINPEDKSLLVWDENDAKWKDKDLIITTVITKTVGVGRDFETLEDALIFTQNKIVNTSKKITLILDDGTYYLDNNIQVIKNYNLVIKSASDDRTKVILRPQNNSLIRLEPFNGGHLYLRNITIDKSDDNSGNFLMGAEYSSSLLLINCDIKMHQPVAAINFGNILLYDCNLETENLLLFLDIKSNARLTNCNLTTHGNFIFAFGNAVAIVKDCTLNGNGHDFLYAPQHDYHLILSNTTINNFTNIPKNKIYKDGSSISDLSYPLSFDGWEGTTTNRPTLSANEAIGQPYFDTDLNKPIWWNGIDWVNSNGDIV